MTTYWIYLGQLKLTHQIHNMDYETMKPHIKQMKTNYETQFPINPKLRMKLKKIN
jgi:hypothetical protein